MQLTNKNHKIQAYLPVPVVGGYISYIIVYQDINSKGTSTSSINGNLSAAGVTSILSGSNDRNTTRKIISIDFNNESASSTSATVSFIETNGTSYPIGIRSLEAGQSWNVFIEPNKVDRSGTILLTSRTHSLRLSLAAPVILNPISYIVVYEDNNLSGTKTYTEAGTIESTATKDIVSGPVNNNTTRRINSINICNPDSSASTVNVLLNTTTSNVIGRNTLQPNQSWNVLSLNDGDVTLPIDTDPTLSADSDLVVPSQKAVKTYVDNSVNPGTVTSVGTSSPLTGGTITGSGTIGIQQASSITDGYVSASDWSTFNSKGNGTVTSVSALTIGATGTDLSSSVTNGTTTPSITLNVPSASATNRGVLSSSDWSTFNSKQDGLVSGTNIKTVNGTSLLGGGDIPVGVTSIGLSTGTSGTDINVSGSPVTGSGSITLNVPTASAANRGLLSSADWSTFNAKQGAISLTTTGTSGAATLVGNTLNIPQYSGGGGGGTDSVNWTHTQALPSIGSVVKAEPVYYNMSGIIATTVNLINRRLYLMGVWVPTGMTITGVKWLQSNVASYTADNYNGVGLYTLSSGTFTRVAQSTNDATVWSQTGTNKLKQKEFSSPYSATAGLYYAAIIINASATPTAPSLFTIPNVPYNSYTLDNTNGVFLSMFSNSQTTMPASLTIPGSYLQASVPYLALY